MEKTELAVHVRRAVVQAMTEALGLATEPRPVVECLDQYLGSAMIAQRVVELLGLADTPDA